ncbi:MAG: 2-iminoacetate synthase ThiH, partial [Enterobacterales bacterium]|nr:2-iminoacetate synthase ThiH [Enterobacterales bacterium]
METFTQRWQQLDWDDIGLRINSKTNADVERALQTFRPDREDMLALLSPA